METITYKEKHPIIKFFTESPSAWKTLIIINVALHLLGVLSESVLATNYLFIYGAKINFYIADYQIYRFVTSMFLHADLFHLLANCYAIYVLGPAIEHYFGTKKFLFIYFIAGIFGSMASFILTANNSLGASGGIFGFFGVHIYLYLRKPDVYKRIFGRSMFFLLALNLYIGFSNQQIDNYAHIGGLIGGLLAAFAVGMHYEKITSFKNILFSTIILVTITGATILGVNYRQTTPDYYYHKTIISFQLNDPETGIKALQDGLNAHPEDADLLKIYTILTTSQDNQ